MPLADPSERSDFLSRPIILIECGRSGSTLVSRMLDAHPEVQFWVETDFLIARLWRAPEAILAPLIKELD